MKINLKDFRQAHRLFQSDLAELLQTNQSTISRMELKNGVSLSYPQMMTLYERFGKEDVDAFAVDEEPKDERTSVVVENNTNYGEGVQNNGYFSADKMSLEIIRKQSEALSNLAGKQSEQTDRLIVLLEKLSEKL